MPEPKSVIADALFNFKSGVEEDKRGHRPWGRERSEWQAEAVIAALQRAGYYIAAPNQSISP